MYIFSQKFEIALWIPLESALRWLYADTNPAFVAFSCHVINQSVVAPGYALFLENARQSPCALSGNIYPYTNTTHIKLLHVCACGVLLVFWRAYRGSEELMDEELSCWSRGKM